MAPSTKSGNQLKDIDSYLFGPSRGSRGRGNRIQIFKENSLVAPRVHLIHGIRISGWRGPPPKASESRRSENFCVPHPRRNIGTKRVSTLRDSDVRIEWPFGHEQGSFAKSRVATNVTTTGSQKVSILKSLKP